MTRTAAVAVALVGLAITLGGCRSTEPVAGSPTADPARAVVSQDPLGDIESTLDAVERELDADTG